MTDEQRKQIERAFAPNPKLTPEQVIVLEDSCNSYAADCELLYEDGLITLIKLTFGL